MVAQRVKNLPVMRETWVWSLDQEDHLEEEMTTHSSVLTWRIPWTEEPGGLYSSWGHKELDTTEHSTSTFSLLSHPVRFHVEALSYFANTLFANKVTFIGSGSEGLDTSSDGHHSTPYTHFDIIQESPAHLTFSTHLCKRWGTKGSELEEEKEASWPSPGFSAADVLIWDFRRQPWTPGAVRCLPHHDYSSRLNWNFVSRPTLLVSYFQIKFGIVLSDSLQTLIGIWTGRAPHVPTNSGGTDTAQRWDLLFRNRQPKIVYPNILHVTQNSFQSK